MDLVIETDLGRDPDDFFAILYLLSCGINIKAIAISPGDQDQIAIAKFILKETNNLHIPVGSSTLRTGVNSSGGMHTKILQKYQYPLLANADGDGGDILTEAMKNNPNSELFVCGPLKNIKKSIEHGTVFNRSTMQGGFVGYDTHNLPCEKLEKFQGQSEVATFNLGGDKVGSELYMTNSVSSRQWVGKNLCHAIVYDRAVHEKIKKTPPKNREMELFHEAMDIHFETHDAKMFHDPTAAVAHLHPEIFTWITGTLYRKQGKYGTILDENGDKVAVDVDRNKLWHHIANGE